MTRWRKQRIRPFPLYYSSLYLTQIISQYSPCVLCKLWWWRKKKNVKETCISTAIQIYTPHTNEKNSKQTSQTNQTKNQTNQTKNQTNQTKNPHLTQRWGGGDNNLQIKIHCWVSWNIFVSHNETVQIRRKNPQSHHNQIPLNVH